MRGGAREEEPIKVCMFDASLPEMPQYGLARGQPGAGNSFQKRREEEEFQGKKTEG